MSRDLKKLLKEGGKIRIKDVKAMLREFKNQKEERKEEVTKMLDNFKKERLEAGKYWKIAQNKISEMRTGSPKVKGF